MREFLRNSLVTLIFSLSYSLLICFIAISLRTHFSFNLEIVLFCIGMLIIIYGVVLTIRGSSLYIIFQNFSSKISNHDSLLRLETGSIHKEQIINYNIFQSNYLLTMTYNSITIIFSGFLTTLFSMYFHSIN